jgi:hypothetical protein
LLYEEKADSSFVVAVGGFGLDAIESWPLILPHSIIHLEIPMSWLELNQYSPTLIMFNDRPLVDGIEKADCNFSVGLGSWLGCYRDLVPHFAIFHTLSRNANIMVRVRPAWPPC